MVNRELEHNYYSEEVRRVDDGGNWDMRIEDTSLQDDALFYSVLSRTMLNLSGGRASSY
jgi:hypothetical protein